MEAFVFEVGAGVGGGDEVLGRDAVEAGGEIGAGSRDTLGAGASVARALGV